MKTAERRHNTKGNEDNKVEIADDKGGIIVIVFTLSMCPLNSPPGILYRLSSLVDSLALLRLDHNKLYKKQGLEFF